MATAKKKKKKSSAEPAPKAMSMTQEDMRWRAREDLNTLSRAEEIKRDSGRMKAVTAEGARQIKALTSALGAHSSANPVKKPSMKG